MYRKNYGYLRLELSLHRIHTHRCSFISHRLLRVHFSFIWRRKSFFDNGIRQFRDESAVTCVDSMYKLDSRINSRCGFFFCDKRVWNKALVLTWIRYWMRRKYGWNENAYNNFLIQKHALPLIFKITLTALLCKIFPICTYTLNLNILCCHFLYVYL